MRATRPSLLCALLLTSLAFGTAGCGFSLGRDSDNTLHMSPAEIFNQTISSMPAGRHVYWLGPHAAAERLDRTSIAGASYRGVDVTYSGDSGVIHVVTYAGARRPSHDVVAGMAVYASVRRGRQLVVIATNYRQLSTAEVQILVNALAPVTKADVDALPEDWGEIEIP